MIKNILTVILSLIALTSFAQQSMNMTEVSNFYPSNVTPGNPEQFNDIWGYVAPDGREYAIFGSVSGTYFIDVTNAASPVEIDYFSGGGTGIWRDFKTYKHYAFGVADVTSGNTLQIFDLQYLPDSVVKIYDDNTFSSNCHNIHVNNDRLYIVSNTRGGSYYPLDVLCIEDPENPYLIGGIRNGINVSGNYSTSHDAFVHDDTVYLSVYFNNTGNDGLHVFDMTDPENPDLIGSIQNYPVAGINHASWMSSDGTHLIMADETLTSPIKMVDITDLSNMQAISTFAPNPGAIAHNPFIKDCLAIISYYHEGVQIYDVSNPSTPTRVGYFDTDTTIGNGNYSPNYRGCWGVYPYLPSGNIIAADRKNGLFVLTYDGAYPNCSGDFDKVVEVDTTKYCEDTVTTVALNKFTANNIEIYPNPSKGIFHVISDQNIINEIAVYDIRGLEISRVKTNIYKRDIQLDLSSEESGIYFVHLFFNEGEKRMKIFKE
ncbi:MAG: choice-of-anchor B family protein [Cytophagales bacterium]